MKKPWVLSYPLSAQRRLIRLSGCQSWSESSLGAHSFCCFCHVVAQLSNRFMNIVHIIKLFSNITDISGITRFYFSLTDNFRILGPSAPRQFNMQKISRNDVPNSFAVSQSMTNRLLNFLSSYKKLVKQLGFIRYCGEGLTKDTLKLQKILNRDW